MKQKDKVSVISVVPALYVFHIINNIEIIGEIGPASGRKQKYFLCLTD